MLLIRQEGNNGGWDVCHLSEGTLKKEPSKTAGEVKEEEDNENIIFKTLPAMKEKEIADLKKALCLTSSNKN
eukprot:4198265-Ditylum_brightwellii.AAC.1